MQKGGVVVVEEYSFAALLSSAGAECAGMSQSTDDNWQARSLLMKAEKGPGSARGTH